MKALSASLSVAVLRPYYPASDLFRVMRDDDGLQLDFMAAIHGIRSLASLRSRAGTVEFEKGTTLLVVSLPDIIAARGQRGGRGILPCHPSWSRPCMSKRATRAEKLEALKKESERDLQEQIRRLLALRPEQRIYFLRKRVGYRMSCV